MQRLAALALSALVLAGCATRRAPLSSGDVLILQDIPGASGSDRALELHQYGGFPISGNRVLIDRPLRIEFE